MRHVLLVRFLHKHKSIEQIKRKLVVHLHRKTFHIHINLGGLLRYSVWIAASCLIQVEYEKKIINVSAIKSSDWFRTSIFLTLNHGIIAMSRIGNESLIYTIFIFIVFFLIIIMER